MHVLTSTSSLKSKRELGGGGRKDGLAVKLSRSEGTLLLQDRSLLPSIQVGWLLATCDSSSRRELARLACASTYPMFTDSHRHIISNKKSKPSEQRCLLQSRRSPHPKQHQKTQSSCVYSVQLWAAHPILYFRQMSSFRFLRNPFLWHPLPPSQHTCSSATG